MTVGDRYGAGCQLLLVTVYLRCLCIFALSLGTATALRRVSEWLCVQEEAMELMRSKQRLEAEDRLRRSLSADELRARCAPPPPTPTPPRAILLPGPPP